MVKTWSKMKEGMRQTLGEYRFSDNTLLTFFGQRVPMATVEYATTITDWLINLGSKMINIAAAAGRPTAAMQSALAKFKSNFATWKKGSDNSFGGRMQLNRGYEWIDLTDRYVIAMSTAQWAAFNNGTPLELWNEALDETTGGVVLRAAWNVAQGIGDAALFAAEYTGLILKGAIIAGVGFAGYSIYKLIPKKKD
jgi:hypothetical protein